MKDILLVTFPVDLGNRTLESNQHSIFKEDMDFYRFAEEHSYDIDRGRVSLTKSVIYRLMSMYKLRKTVRRYSKQNKLILFNGLSPAVFSFGAWRPERTAIVFDWTRTLYPSILGHKIKKDIVFAIHKAVLGRCLKFLCWTDAIKNNLQDIYGIKEGILYKVPAPFLVEKLSMAPRPTPKRPRVLFIGGDFERKGGDVLIEGFRERRLKEKCTLTMVTNHTCGNLEAVKFLKGVKYGSEAHRVIFEEHDILVLPTRMDAYPQVIGEAASAGLAVITTQFALGAAEVIIDGFSGFIAGSPEECLELLTNLLDNHEKIDSFKSRGYQLMHDRFSKDSIRKSYFEVLEFGS